MNTTKVNVGQRVRIIDHEEADLHIFKVGEIVTIEELMGSGVFGFNYLAEGGSGRVQWIDDRDFEVIESEYDARDMNVSLLTVEDAIQNIISAFVWDKSPEGHSYWSEVVCKLEAIKEAARNAGIKD
ncbi:MAG: hypothetical protein PVI03_03995 [Candidatus Thorarchaeota archaeon]|jgi:hypothetical protein